MNQQLALIGAGVGIDDINESPVADMGGTNLVLYVFQPVGEVDSDKQRADDMACHVSDGQIFRHVIASEQVGPAEVGFAGLGFGIAGMFVVEQRADGALAFFVPQ